MGIGLGREDEFFHGHSDEPRVLEWLDFNFYDISGRFGGFFRLHHRPGLGFTEMTLCLYLPDGRTAFMSERSGLGGGTHLGAGGLRVEVIRPFDELSLSYDGRLLLIEDPCALVHPERAYAENPQTDGTVGLTFCALSTLYEDYGDPSVERSGSFGGHYEQLTAATGSVRIGDDRFDVEGLGLRGHGWGIGVSSAPSYTRRLTANVSPSFGFLGFDVGLVTGANVSGGFVWDGTAFHVCDALSVTTLWTGADSVHHGVDVTLRDGDQPWHARGAVIAIVVRRADGAGDDGGAGRVSEGLTEWRLDDGQIGYGMSEYFDRIVDGKPSGLAG